MTTAINQPPLFLASGEIEELTGYKLPAHQTKWLRMKGWRFELNGNRKPVIARKYAEKMLGCFSDTQENFPRPNFGALRAS
jgi:hypothetical protein